MGELFNMKFQRTDRERVLDIVEMYNVWAKQMKYRTCPVYRLNHNVANGKTPLSQFLKMIAGSHIEPEEFAMVLKSVDESLFLQTLIKIDNLFYWLFKEKDGTPNYVNVMEDCYKNKQGHKEGELAYATPEEASKIMDKGFLGMEE